jgi:hypothetical protein|tara:strand:+ start:90 stop:650 length:561 start_codon:yes stop_codon:yes gene_type:complete
MLPAPFVLSLSKDPRTEEQPAKTSRKRGGASVFIKVEPADFFMFRVIMTFDLEYPDSEDQDVRDYLTEHELEPRYTNQGEFEDRQCEFMQFGGCYLGNHLQNISQIQRVAVEVELLTAEIRVHLNISPDAATPLAEDQQTAIAQLIKDFHQDSSFQTNENGELIVVLDGDAVRAAANQLASVSSDD